MESRTKAFTVGTLGVVLFSIMLRTGTFGTSILNDIIIQRSWMRITINFPIEYWYNTMPFPEYWTIDYPPLSTWHQCIFGLLGKAIDPDVMTSYYSLEKFPFKTTLFMRFTVLITEIIIFFPAAIVLLTYLYPNIDNKKKNGGLLCILSSPMILYFDYVSFQYNITTIGLVITSTIFTLKKSYCISAVFLSFAVNYKVYAMYYSIPFITYWILKIVTKENYKTEKFLNIGWKIFKIFCSGVLAAAVVWLPWLEIDTVSMIMKRVLDFGRPYVEERVGNLWYFLCTFIKFEKYMSNESIALMCMIVTLTACLPFVYLLLKKPNNTVFLYSASGCCLSFFLFSYMVKGKTAIFPSIFFSFLIVIDEPSLFQVLNIIATMNNYDPDTRLSYFIFQIIFYIISTYYINNVCGLKRDNLHTAILLSGALIHFLEILQPSDRYLNLHKRMTSIFCFGVFVYTWLHILLAQSKLCKTNEKNKTT
jgi:alpha-1,3-glucosyltransferase